MVVNTEPSAEGQFALKAILVVVHESETAERLVQVIREETPYHPLRVADGRTACEVIRSVKPDLFLLDDHLPDMTGFDLYDHLHAIAGLEHVPALFLHRPTPTHAFDPSFVSSPPQSFELDYLWYMIQELLAGPTCCSDQMRDLPAPMD